MFCINEIPISLQQDKKRFYDFFRVKLQPFMKYRSPSLFSVTQQHEIDHTWLSLTFFWRHFFFHKAACYDTNILSLLQSALLIFCPVSL